MTLAPIMSGQHRGSRQRASWPMYRWDPYRDMQQTNDPVGRLIRTFFGEPWTGGDAGALSLGMVPVDVEETDDAYIVDVDLPNVNPEDVTLEMRGEELRVAGRYQQRERSGVVRRQNRPEGDFEYLVDLPSDIDPNRVDATYEDGVLTVTVGKTREAQPRRIEIHPSQRQPQIGQGDGQRDRQQASATEGQQARQGQQETGRSS